MTPEDRLRAIGERAGKALQGVALEPLYLSGGALTILRYGPGGGFYQLPDEAEAAFVFHAREDIPWLLARVAELERLGAGLETARLAKIEACLVELARALRQAGAEPDSDALAPFHVAKAEIAALHAREAALRATCAPFARFVEAFDARPIDEFYGIHGGEAAGGASLRLSDCRRVRAALAEANAKANHGSGWSETGGG